MSTIDFSHLRLLAVFATVVETHSFAAASRQLQSSRSRISEQVSQLETVLGVRLFQRSTRQLLITQEGRKVYEEAKQLPPILNNIESIVTPTEPHGRVTITMNHDIAHKFILPLLGKFQERYPLINLDLILDDEESDLIAEQIDLGIRIGPPKDNSLIGRVIHEESLDIFASPAYLAANDTPKTIEDLEKCHWILLPQFELDNVLRLRSENKTIEIHPKTYHRCNSPLMMQKMVAAGLGVGTLLPSMIMQEIDNQALIKIMPQISSEPLLFSLVYPSRRQVPQRTRVLIDFLLNTNIFNH